MKQYATIEVSVCKDCAMVIANGETGNENVSDESIAEAIAEEWPVDVWTIVLEEFEGEFQAGPCDTCGEFLAGDRFRATAMSI